MAELENILKECFIAKAPNASKTPNFICVDKTILIVNFIFQQFYVFPIFMFYSSDIFKNEKRGYTLFKVNTTRN